jgi:hypothetical protein
MSIFRQAVNIPTVASSSANIGTYNGLIPPTPGNSINLTLNGSLVGINGQVSFISNGYASGLSFTSGLNVSTSTFTIVGTYNGLIIQESLAGPNNNTVYTNNLFHTIISISATGGGVANAFTIGSNYNIAVVLPDGNSKSGLTHPNYNYSILLNSLTAAGQWAAGNAIIYGVSNIAPVSLQASNLTYANRPSNYFALPVTGAALAAITQAQLNNGIIVQTTYPYAAVIVYLAAGINTTPVYIEISQS